MCPISFLPCYCRYRQRRKWWAHWATFGPYFFILIVCLYRYQKRRFREHGRFTCKTGRLLCWTISSKSATILSDAEFPCRTAFPWKPWYWAIAYFLRTFLFHTGWWTLRWYCRSGTQPSLKENCGMPLRLLFLNATPWIIAQHLPEAFHLVTPKV